MRSNRAAAALFRRATPDELLGLALEALFPDMQASPEDASKTRWRDFEAMARERGHHRVEWSLQQSVLEVTLVPHPEPGGFVAIVRDISQQKMREQELIDALLTIIGDTLELSEVEPGTPDLESMNFSLHAAVADALRKVEPAAKSKAIALRSSISIDVPALVRGDPGRFRQILLHCLGNTIELTDVGFVEVRLGVTNSRSRELMVRCEVLDAGIHIPREPQGQLVRPSQQGEAALTRRHGGTELGLAICARLAQIMGGDAGGTSESDKGAMFWFTARLGIVPGDQTVEATRYTTPGALPSFPGRRILVAEDNHVSQRIKRRLLERLGCTVEIAENGKVMLAALERSHYDAVLVDCSMPVLGGLDAAREVRRRDWPTRDIPLIAATAINATQDECLEAGMNDYLSVPCSLDALANVLLRWLGGKPPRE